MIIICKGIRMLYTLIFIIRKERTTEGYISRGSYKEKPTELSWQYVHLHQREAREREEHGTLLKGGGQNANKLC